MTVDDEKKAKCDETILWNQKAHTFEERVELQLTQDKS